jgi:hypothetical protein
VFALKAAHRLGNINVEDRRELRAEVLQEKYMNTDELE